jgi:histidinol phosphatase-like enzyme
MDNNKLKKQAMGIVNQLYDLAEVQVDKRQQINDKADEYMIEQLLIQRVSNLREMLIGYIMNEQRNYCGKPDRKLSEDLADDYIANL